MYKIECPDSIKVTMKIFLFILTKKPVLKNKSVGKEKLINEVEK